MSALARRPAWRPPIVLHRPLGRDMYADAGIYGQDVGLVFLSDQPSPNHQRGDKGG